MEEDLKLVDQVLKGNIDSFNILVNKYELSIFKFTYNMIRDKEAAEDITQEVFIIVYKKIYTYNREYKFSSWLFQVARNKCIDFMRKYKRVYEANIEDEKTSCSKGISPEAMAELRETKKEIQTFINTLEELDREILVLRYSGEVTFIEIASILNINKATIKRRYYKIRERYRDFISPNETRCKI
ncbi:MAG: sigma-70 family RNA polymerase sigma factor [Clostridiaceae bacterium]|nr:sigma-70 family RNA polymerase sigma factor [Clostridiaceae bacterium]